jgi:hypothetical protein
VITGLVDGTELGFDARADRFRLPHCFLEDGSTKRTCDFGRLAVRWLFGDVYDDFVSAAPVRYAPCDAVLCDCHASIRRVENLRAVCSFILGIMVAA